MSGISGFTAMLWGGPADGTEMTCLPNFQHYIRLPVLSHLDWSIFEDSEGNPEVGMAVYRCQRSVGFGVYQYVYESTIWSIPEKGNPDD